MEAKVKPDSIIFPVVAFTGHYYNRTQWSPVPDGCEAEAKRHPFLLVREDGDNLEVEPDAVGMRGKTTAKDITLETESVADLTNVDEIAHSPTSPSSGSGVSEGEDESLSSSSPPTRCAAKTASGKQCRNKASKGDYCHLHAR